MEKSSLYAHSSSSVDRSGPPFYKMIWLKNLPKMNNVTVFKRSSEGLVLYRLTNLCNTSLFIV